MGRPKVPQSGGALNSADKGVCDVLPEPRRWKPAFVSPCMVKAMKNCNDYTL